MTRACAEQIEAPRIQRHVVAGKFHNRAETIARLHGRHGHAMLFEDKGNFWTTRGPGHGERIAFAGLNGDLAAEVDVEARSPSARCDDECVRSLVSSGSPSGGCLIAALNEAVKITVFENFEASFA